VIEPQAEKIVTEAAEMIGEGRHPERGSAFGIATFKHVTIVLVSAGTVAAIGATVGGGMGAAFGGAIGTAVATASTWLGLETLKTRAVFKAAIAALGERYDSFLETGGGRLHQRLIGLAPLRQFVTDNQEPLRDQHAANALDALLYRFHRSTRSEEGGSATIRRSQA